MNKITLILLAISLGIGAAACGELNPKTEGQINSALTAAKEQFKACYDQAIKEDRLLAGDMELALKFDPKGKKPTEVKVVKSNINNPTMQACVAKAAGEITIDEAPGVFVNGFYTVSFSSKM